MAARNLVNLDAMLTRADFAQAPESDSTYDTVPSISIRDLSKDEGMMGKLLRKPDFQRETNHWSPEQVVSLLECFLNGDLIPSVILWKAPVFLFVIDGGHRLSVLKAWVEDDYGDGPLSVKYFEDSISANQRRAAARTRKLVADKIGTYQHHKTRMSNGEYDARIASISIRALPVQWVKGDAAKAESSFFKINSQGTPLDDTEEMLLRYRNRPIAIASRAIIRAGKGNKYWSAFNAANAAEVEKLAKSLHVTLFDPEVSNPIKTLDLPLGGAKGIRTALQIMIDYLSIACMKQEGKKVVDGSLETESNDMTGEATIEVLKKAKKLSERLTGNDHGSLGLHPAIYYYGPSGLHSSPMFLGTARFIGTKLLNNDSAFFRHFTDARQQIEASLIEHKELIADAMQKMHAKKRSSIYAVIIGNIYEAARQGQPVTDADIVKWSGLTGRILTGIERGGATDFNEEVKSRIFITMALRHAYKCSICGGYLDPAKSAQYDHIKRVREGGLGGHDNGQMVHPYCNQSVKN